MEIGAVSDRVQRQNQRDTPHGALLFSVITNEEALDFKVEKEEDRPFIISQLIQRFGELDGNPIPKEELTEIEDALEVMRRDGDQTATIHCTIPFGTSKSRLSSAHPMTPLSSKNVVKVVRSQIDTSAAPSRQLSPVTETERDICDKCEKEPQELNQQIQMLKKDNRKLERQLQKCANSSDRTLSSSQSLTFTTKQPQFSPCDGNEIKMRVLPRSHAEGEGSRSNSMILHGSRRTFPIHVVRDGNGLIVGTRNIKFTNIIKVETGNMDQFHGDPDPRCCMTLVTAKGKIQLETKTAHSRDEWVQFIARNVLDIKRDELNDILG